MAHLLNVLQTVLCPLPSTCAAEAAHKLLHCGRTDGSWAWELPLKLLGFYNLQGSATLSMAYAGALFADACLRGLNGDSNVVEPTFVQSTVTELPFFASKVRLGPSGAPLRN